MSGSGEELRTFELIQRWFQAVITHTGGAEEGIRSPEAQDWISLAPREADRVVRRSASQTAIERLSIYANAYYARLLECLGNGYPVLKRTLGEEVFDSFALEYLQQYPSRTYTLDLLGEHFCRFLQETRPDREDTDDAGWPDFLIDLATLEWTIGRVYDGPGTEGQEVLTLETLQSFPAERFAEARLIPAGSLKLLSFRYPVSAYYTAVRRAGEKESASIPAPKTEHVAILRRDFIVRRYPLTDPQLVLLQNLQAGATVGEAIAAAVVLTDRDDDSLCGALQSWFRLWSADGFFAAISLNRSC